MRRIGQLLMSTVLVTGCAGLATNNESLQVVLERKGEAQPRLSPYDEGKRQLQFGNPGLAIDAFQAALRQDPDSVLALNGIAVAYDRLGRAEVAQRFLDHALTVDANSAVTLNNLAYLNLVQGNTAVALAYAERAKIAAALPRDMMLPDAISKTVSRNVEIAIQLAASEAKDPATAEVRGLPPERDVKRLGLNEWQLRIRPPNPAETVRINLPISDAAPRVIESVARPAVTPPAMEMPATAVVISDIPTSVLADLSPPAPETAPAETLVASLPETVDPEPSTPPPDAPTAAGDVAAREPEAATPLSPEAPVSAELMAPPEPEFPSPQPVDAVLAPSSAIPEPVIASLLELPVIQSAPIATEPVVVVPPVPEALGPMVALLPTPDAPQPLPEPAHDEPTIAALLGRTYSTPAPEAIATTLPVVQVIPPLQLPEPAREELVVAALPAQDRIPPFLAPVMEAIAAPPAPPIIPPQLLPEPVREEQVVAALPAFPAPVMEAIAVPPAPRTIPPQQLPEPVREEQVVAALPAFPVPAMEAIAAPPAPPIIPPQQLPEPVREEPVIVAALSPPEPAEPLALFLAPVIELSDLPTAPIFTPPGEAVTSSPQVTRLKEVLASLSVPSSPPVAPAAPPHEAPKAVEPTAPPARLSAPMVASLAPSRADTLRSVEPAGLKADWRASVPASTDVRVSNGTGRRLMAGRFARYFREHGLSVRKIANANSFDYRRTVIFYNPDQRAHAEALAAALPFQVKLVEAKHGHGQIELVLGFDLIAIDETLRSA